MNPLIELLPLILFFVAYKLYDFLTATAVLLVSTFVVLLFVYLKQRKVLMMPLVSAGILGVFGGLTLFNENSFFLLIKPTIVNCLFGSVLLLGLFSDKLLVLKHVFKEVLEMENPHWRILTVRWAMLFFFLAGLNEVIWRNFSEEFWVGFKVFGMLPITIIFMLFQIPFLKKHSNFVGSEDEKK
ncbi:MAG: septation protein IspZ [Rickettsiales bacterium]|nr:septation protein IspZ [Rickettsiales bacterium]